MLKAAPELISATRLGVRLPDAAIVRGRELVWTRIGLLLATRCEWPDGAYRTVLHRYDADALAIAPDGKRVAWAYEAGDPALGWIPLT